MGKGAKPSPGLVQPTVEKSEMHLKAHSEEKKPRIQMHFFGGGVPVLGTRGLGACLFLS